MTTGAAEGRVEVPGASPEGNGWKSREKGIGSANVTGRKAAHWPEAATGLMEKIVSRGNMMAAYSRVMRNKGAPGVDSMPVTALKGYLQVIPYDLVEIILELQGPFRASGQYHMKAYEKKKGYGMIVQQGACKEIGLK